VLGDVEATSEVEAIAKRGGGIQAAEGAVDGGQTGLVTRLQQFDKIRVGGPSLLSRIGHDPL